MIIKRLAFILAIVITCLFVMNQMAFANQILTVDSLKIEYGWINEPVIAGEPNAIVIKITDSNSNPNHPTGNEFDISNFILRATYGSHTIDLALRPLGENTPGHYIAPITPSQPGVYTLHLSGTIGSTAFNNDVIPGEVFPSDPVKFPSDLPITETSSTSTAAFWFGIAGLVLGASGIAIGIFSYNRKQRII